MSVKKTIESQFEPLYKGFNLLAHDLRTELSNSLAGFADKLDKQKKPTYKSRVIAFRNWLTHLLLWAVLSILLSSCFVSGRTIHVVTPRVDVSADTATAYTFPYGTKFQ